MNTDDFCHLLNIGETCMFWVKYVFLFLGVLIISCTSSQPEGKGIKLGTLLSYETAQPLDLKYSDLFSKVETVPLDTVNDFLVSEVRQFRFALDRFFVLNREELLIFNRQGKGVARINRYGQGREEYLHIGGFDISEQDSTICLYTFPTKLMYFSLDGKLIREHPMDGKGFEIALLPDHSYAIYTDNAKEAEEGEKTLLDTYDEKNGVWKSFVPGYASLENRLLPSFQQNRVFTHVSSGREVLFFHPLTNHIYSIISKDSVRVKYTLDFGKNNPPKDAPETMRPEMSVTDFVMKHWPVYGFNGCWENDRYFYIQTFVDKQLRDILYDKQIDQLYAGWFTDDLLYCQMKPVAATDSFLVGHLSADVLLGLKDYLESRQEKEIPPLVSNLLEHAEKMDNPIVCLYHFK